MSHRSPQRDLNDWLSRHGYYHAHSRKTGTVPPYAHKTVAASASNHGPRMVHQSPTGRAVFAAHEREHHITTSGRRTLERWQFALPPRSEEKRRGIKGRVPIDTAARARNALQRASQMQKRGHLSTRELAAVRRAVRHAWPEIAVEG